MKTQVMQAFSNKTQSSSRGLSSGFLSIVRPCTFANVSGEICVTIWLRAGMYIESRLGGLIASVVRAEFVVTELRR